MTALTERTLPHPWDVCDGCGKVAALPMPGQPRDAMCGACVALELLHNAAHESFKELTAPVIGGWASHWGAAGVTLEDLSGILETEAQHGMTFDYARAYFAQTVRELSQAHPIPTFTKNAPDRASLSAADFPTLAECRPADPAQGISSAWFVDTKNRAHTISRGADTLSVRLIGGDVLLIFTGAKGQTRFDLPTGAGLHVPAHLWPDVERALSAGQAKT